MRLLYRIVVVILLLSAVGLGVRPRIQAYLRSRSQPEFRQMTVSRGTVRETVRATGRVEPKLRVQIGAFVSGPIVELNVNFNDEVAQGDVLARIDPAIYLAAVQRDEATLATANAEVERVQALLQQSRNNERRGFALAEENSDFISEAELDSLRFGRMSLEAQLTFAQAAVKQAAASLGNSRANLDYTEIKAPADGMVIDRKIEPGQTLAAQFQTPELFVLGVDMRNEMYVYASVDEADIGRIRQAQANDQPVRFVVDAYADTLFEGRIKEIRLSSTETQSVVTYPVVVTAANPELKLLPGMTARLTFQVEERSDALQIPTAALRFFPNRTELVREQDRPLLEGRQQQESKRDDVAESADEPPVEELMEARRQQQRHVWILQTDGLLRAVAVKLGISDYNHAELLEGELKPGDRLVVGVKNK